MCGRAVKTSNSGFGRLGFKPRPLPCFLRQGRLLHFSQVYKMGTGVILLRGGGQERSGESNKACLHAKETGISSDRLGLWLVCIFIILLTFKSTSFLDYFLTIINWIS